MRCTQNSKSHLLPPGCAAAGARWVPWIPVQAVLAAVLSGMMFCTAAAAAAAEALDHRSCSRVLDSSTRTAAADLETLLGPDSDCVVRAAARRLCVPADAASAATGEESLSVAGPELADDQVCYRIDCPQRVERIVQVKDRFGVRPVTVTQARTWCVPSQPPR